MVSSEKACTKESGLGRVLGLNLGGSRSANDGKAGAGAPREAGEACGNRLWPGYG